MFTMVPFCAGNTTNLLMMLFLAYDSHFCQIKVPKFYKKQKSTPLFGKNFFGGVGNEFFLVGAEFGVWGDLDFCECVNFNVKINC